MLASLLTLTVDFQLFYAAVAESCMAAGFTASLSNTLPHTHTRHKVVCGKVAWLGSRVVSVLDSGAEGPGFKLQPRRCRVTDLGKLFTPIVPLFTKQRNW